MSWPRGSGQSALRSLVSVRNARMYARKTIQKHDIIAIHKQLLHNEDYQVNKQLHYSESPIRGRCR